MRSSRFAQLDLLIGGMLYVATAAYAQAPDGAENSVAISTESGVEDIRACVRKNLPTTSSQQDMHIVSTDRTGSERKLSARGFWRRFDDKIGATMHVKAPADLSGSSYLVLEQSDENGGRDAIYMYLAALQRVRRVQGQQAAESLWGTDFSYEDVKQVQGILTSGKTEKLADETLADRKVWVLSVTPAEADVSNYMKVVSYVDQQTCVVLQTEFFEREGQPRKRLTADATSLAQLGDRWVVKEYLMQDLRDETQTTLSLSNIEHDQDIPSRLFSRQSFYRGN